MAIIMDSITSLLFKVLCHVVLIMVTAIVALGGLCIIKIAYYEVFRTDIGAVYNKLLNKVKPEKKVVKKNVKLNEGEETYNKWDYRG